MKNFPSICTHLSWMVFAGIALMQMPAHSSSLDEHFKAALNSEILKVKNTDNPAAKREMLGNFLKRMDAGIGIAKNLVPEKDCQGLSALQLKLQTDNAELNGTPLNGRPYSKISDKDLNSFAGYVQQDAEQADEVIFIGGGGLLIVLLILLLILH